MAHRIGIDAGSKTIKVVVLDDNDAIAFSMYRRHRFDIATLLASLIHDVIWRYGDLEGTVAITGSAGIELAEWLELPFIQEVIATTKAVQNNIPDANAVIELGGEDAKIIYLDDPVEQRMNATCAGGTGGFIDTIAFMLGLRSKDFSQTSMGASHIYPIASRCAVFAQTDVRPLLNAGANKADIAASALEAVVRQTIGGLACGRPIRGKVIFLGGPCEFIPDLVRRFQKALKLEKNMGVKPNDAHLFTAQGAALFGGEQPDAPIVKLSALEARLKEQNQPKDDLARLAPLFCAPEELLAFETRHEKSDVSTEPVTMYEGPLYLGLDAGSTAVKLACISPDGKLIYSDNAPTNGDVLQTARDMLSTMYTYLPHGYNGKRYYTIDHATVTGYGENMLRAALNFDSGVVETIAHTAAALHFDPEASFVLDIGGQDMKAIWIEDGVISETILNEACSSGCGSFIEGTAYSLRSTPAQFSSLATGAKAPIDLGTKCTVFMTSRVRHAQKIGATVDDIAAGIAYSVVQNALFRIIGMNNVDSMGDHIVVQGGAFMSNAVLRAFELISGKEVTRPGCAHLMGAYGAALIARNRDFAEHGTYQQETISDAGYFRMPEDPIGRTGLLTLDQIKQLTLQRISSPCKGCQNNCAVTILKFDDNRSYISGNRCERALDFFELGQKKAAYADVPPNAIELKQKLLARYTSTRSDKTTHQPTNRTQAVRIGIMNTLNTTDQLPFWHTLLHALGFELVVVHSSAEETATRNRVGLETIPSESVCFPAKLSHSKLFALLEAGATHILMPSYERGKKCPVWTLYSHALQDSVVAFDITQPQFIAPQFQKSTVEGLCENPSDLQALYDCLKEIQDAANTLTRKTFDEAIVHALAEQNKFVEMVSRGNEKAIEWANKPHHHGMVVVGRPYHCDPVLLHEIDSMLQDLGFAVLSAQELDLPNLEKKADFQSSKPFLQVATYLNDKPNIHMVCLESFGCTYDALSLPEIKQALKGTGKPFTALKIDEIADIAHIRIRLRTLAETIALAEMSQTYASAFDEAQLLGEHGNNNETRVCINPQYYVDKEKLNAALNKNIAAYKNFSQADLDVARMFTSDLCYVVSVLAGRTIRLVASAQAQSASLETLTVPAICKKCVLEGLPGIIKRICKVTPQFEWIEDWPCAENISLASMSILEDEKPPTCDGMITAENTRPQVGIIGTAPLCYEPFLNDNIALLVENLGYELVYPRLSSIFTDNVQYKDELEYFYKRGVRKVIYLQSFGCLKGHVDARGSLHELANIFPGMQITVLDYDAEASALNRENRIRLALGNSSHTN